MKITALRLRKLRGTMPTSDSFWEERLARPIDVYPEYRARPDFEGGQQDESGFAIETYFVQIETEEGAVGIHARQTPSPAFRAGRRAQTASDCGTAEHVPPSPSPSCR
jgi:L-rhamnonate dehydratase